MPGNIKTDAAEEKRRHYIQLQEQLDEARRELKRKDEEIKQLTIQWKGLLNTIRDLRNQAEDLDALLKEERAADAQRTVKFQAAIAAERETLATIYDSVGWRILDRYQRLRESSNLLSGCHNLLVATVNKLMTRRQDATPALANHGHNGAPTGVINEIESQHQAESGRETVGLESTEVLEQGAPTDVDRGEESRQRWEPVEDLASCEFAEVLEPTVSVVIPVYNHAEFTGRCLRSLCQNSTGNSFEVIVVDDCSTDETQDLLGRIKGIRVVRNTMNSGFIVSCNRGAALARGRYIWFLNNDAVVMPGSLDALVATFLEFPDAGLVGSKLLYPDGKLQEVGGIIWKDASACNYGRADDPDKPEYSYLRDVDWCSGASIMIPNSLFHELGGFDPRYAPAYYEDVDLAFAVRQTGKRVLVQPQSRVVHVEGVSSGTDIQKGIKQFQQVNQGKFYQKWKDQLALYCAPGANPSWEKDRYAKGRILVIDGSTPAPDRDLASSLVYLYLKICTALSYKTTFIPADDFLYLEPHTSGLQSIGVECLYAPSVVDVERHLRERGSEYDVVMLFRSRIAAKYIDVVRDGCPRAVVILNLMDFSCGRKERGATADSSGESGVQAKQEKTLALASVRKADGTIVFSEAECESLNRESPGANAAAIPIFNLRGSRTLFDDRRDVCFLCDCQDPSNIDALSYFVGSIWPLVKQKLPAAKFYVLGANVTDETRDFVADDGVVVDPMGDLSWYLDRCRISVLPLRHGADLNGKIGQSMSYGVPCVSTSVAVEGLGLKSRQNILIGDRHEDFAREVVTLYTDKELWGQLSSSGISFVEKHWSIEVGQRKLAELLDRLKAAPARPVVF